MVPPQVLGVLLHVHAATTTEQEAEDSGARAGGRVRTAVPQHGGGHGQGPATAQRPGAPQGQLLNDARICHGYP